VGSPYFTDQRSKDAASAYPSGDDWPSVDDWDASGARTTAGLPPRSPVPPPVPPPGEFGPRAGYPHGPDQPGAYSYQGSAASAHPGRRDPRDDGYRDRHADTDAHAVSSPPGGGYSGHDGYPRHDDYPRYDDYLVSDQRTATGSLPASATFVTARPETRGRGASVFEPGGGRDQVARVGESRRDGRPADGRPGGSRPTGIRAVPGGRSRGERADRLDGGQQRVPGAHRAPLGRPGSARARLAIASTASLAGLSALVGTAVLVTDTGPLTIQPGAGGTATGQFPRSDANEAAAGRAAGGQTVGTPHLTPPAPTGTQGSQRTTPPTEAPVDPTTTFDDLTSTTLFGDGSYDSAAGPLSPSSVDPSTDPTAAATQEPQSDSLLAGNGGLSYWLGLGGFGNGISGGGTGTSSPADTPEPSTTPSAAPSSPPAATSAQSTSAQSTSTSSGQPSGNSASSTPAPQASPAPSPSAVRSVRSVSDPFVVTSPDPADELATTINLSF